LAGKKEVNRDGFVRFPEQKAWILQSPLDVRYLKMSLGRTAAREFRLRRLPGARSMASVWEKEVSQQWAANGAMSDVLVGIAYRFGVLQTKSSNAIVSGETGV
jgi:hypothetical protein